MTMRLIIVSGLAALLFNTHAARPAEPFHSDWRGTRIWIGPEYWPNPLQDWSVEDGELVGLSARGRDLQLLTHQISDDPGGFAMEVIVRRVGQVPESAAAGFKFGIQSALDDYRHTLVHATQSVQAGVRGDGRLMLRDELSDDNLALQGPIHLRLRITHEERRPVAELLAKDADGKLVRVTTSFTRDMLPGNIALFTDGPANDRGDGSWRFRDWRVAGAQIATYPERVFGPILWTQYTLSRGVLKLSAQFPPLGEQDEREARLEIERDGAWRELRREAIEPLARTAVFRIEDWKPSEATPYRVVYTWNGRDYFWTGTVRSDPADQPIFALGAFSCDHGEVFPLTRLTRNVAVQDPDLLFFAGDQIYESHGGFGVARQASVEIAMLDYLRKWYQFGWSWRDLMRDRPSVIIPDDHDVFQGNIWGHGGRALDGKSYAFGGYAMPPAWVNAVQRTQTGHLPDPVDPAPVDQGIGVYFTDILYGGMSFAVLEDRKFKSGPQPLLDGQRRAVPGNAAALDVPSAELLGKRQEQFIERWARDDAADFKVVLSQTIFCQVTTHIGQQLNPAGADVDTNGWPQSARDRALELLQPANAIMVHGDQHLGALVRHGVKEWEDGPLGFMVPGTSNGFPRAWWPDEPGANHQPPAPNWTGRYSDPFGNRMTVLAAANPEKGSNQLSRRETHPERLAHLKGSGHGIVKFDRNSREVTFELWRYLFDATSPEENDQFVGFPQVLPVP